MILFDSPSDEYAYEAMPVPLLDRGHAWLPIGQTGVSLESVGHLHQQGDGRLDIVPAFDTVQFTDVYAVLAWALRHAQDVGAYLKRRDQEAAQIRRLLAEANLTLRREESARMKEKLMRRPLRHRPPTAA